MSKSAKIFCTLLLTFFSSGKLFAQSGEPPRKEIRRNNINTYAGMVEYNINYERNLLYSAITSTNIRVGGGIAAFLTAGTGTYLNLAAVQLLGKSSSHLELDLGLKYLITNSIVNPGLSESLVPDLFAGYRFEKPTGRLILRLGMNYPTLFNAGFGYKF